MFDGMGLLFIPFFGMFFFVFGIILFTVIKGIGQWNKNNHSPRLTVEATVVAKRTHMSRGSSHHHDGHFHTASGSTSYYATFQVSSGDRMELCIPAHEYGYLVEGDRGHLSFQGTRFLSFQRGGWTADNG